MTRPSAVAVVAVVAALLGGTAALVVGKATGWLEGEGRTVVVPASDGAAPASSPVTARPTSKPLAGNDFEPAEIYRERAAGVVTIYSLFRHHAAKGERGVSQGSGFVVSADGYILTNSHVITTPGGQGGDDEPAAAESVYVEFRDGDRASARIIGWDVFNDVGLVKVDPREHRVTPVPLGDSSRVVVGEPVAAIGSPFGNENSLAVGVVAGTQRSIESLTSSYNVVDAIQTDAPINRGNSGGPMFNARGEVIGINAQIRSESGTAEGVGFAIPINSAKRSMRQLIETGRVRYAWVGVTTDTVTPGLARRFGYEAKRGAAIQRVVPGSPADKAGLRGGGKETEYKGTFLREGGDLVVAINGTPVESADDLVRIVAERLLPGQKAMFTIVRGSERRTVDVVLTDRPLDPPDPDR